MYENLTKIIEDNFNMSSTKIIKNVLNSIDESYRKKSKNKETKKSNDNADNSIALVSGEKEIIEHLKKSIEIATDKIADKIINENKNYILKKIDEKIKATTESNTQKKGAKK